MAKLNKTKIKAQLATNSLINSLHVLTKVDSTNSYLKSIKPQKTANICIADQQTSGFGRRGNTWHSDGDNICFSVQWQFALKPEKLSNLAIITSIICALQLQDLGFPQVLIKWPNDLIYHDKKLGGILIEQDYNKQTSTVIIGIGINAAIAPGAPIDQDWIDLLSINSNFSRETIIIQIIQALLPTLNNIKQQNLLNEYWHKFDWLNQQAVVVKSGRNSICGIAQGINPDGSLRVKTNNAIQNIYSGDCSLRKK